MRTSTVIWLAVGAAVLAVLIVTIRHMLRTRQTLLQAFLYGVNAFYNRFIWRTTLNSPMPELPPGQGAIVVANHRSGNDPMFLQYGTSRVVHWMVAAEYATGIWLRWFFAALGTIPARRGGVDSAAIKRAIELARQGAYVGMLPEGRINTSEKLLLSGRPGVAKVALKARAKIIPAYIQGAPYNGHILGPLYMFARVKVTFGEPIDISEFYGRERDREVLGELTKRIMKEIAKLAGHPEFEPEIAGGRDWKDMDVEQVT